jgi:putative ABC transport system ATP-binding protein
VVSRPALVLADEPTANLDSKSADDLMNLFTELNERHGTTFIMATHDQRVMVHARRRVHMLDGRIVEDRLQDPVARTPGGREGDERQDVS